MSIVVEMRERRICACTSLGLAPASTIHVACEVRKQRQLIQGRPSLRGRLEVPRQKCCCHALLLWSGRTGNPTSLARQTTQP